MKLKARTLIGVSEDGKHETPITDVVVNRKGSDIASESYLRLETAFGDFFNVTGTTTIIGLGTSPAGREVTLRFTGALTLTSNTTSLILSGANITTVAGDVARFRSLGGGNWVMVGYKGQTLNSFVGVTDASDATPGSVGEYLSNLVPVGTVVAMSNDTVVAPLSISLTAGDWDVEGNIIIGASSATITAATAGITIVVATLPTDGSECYSGVRVTTTTVNIGITLPRKRISISTTTTCSIVAKLTFSAGSAQVYGAMTARRVR